MKKTLVVAYTPREGSNTKKLLDHFIKNAEGKTEIEFLDLASAPVPMFTRAPLNAYVKRNFGGAELNAEEARAIEPIDKMCDQLIAADYIVLAYPVYNFTFPGPVKCWFDAVIQSGKAFRYTEHGFEGLLKGKRSLVLSTSGGDYSSNSAWDFSTPLVQGQFSFMGVDPKVITAGGMSMDTERTAESLNQAMVKIDDVTSEWFK